MADPAAPAPDSVQRIRTVWRHRGPAAFALWPLSLLYRGLLELHRLPYRLGLRRAGQVGVPVVVIGNVIAGGAGKTPVTLAMVQHLKNQGWRPGVVSRGYGRHTQDCREAHSDSPPQEVGDEPALIARSAGVPVFVARQRLEAAQSLLKAYPQTNIIVCDDGLQHLALARDVEICVFNDEGLGNGFLLPAGPLREPWPRRVDAVLHAAALPPANTLAPAYRLQRRLCAQARNAHGHTLCLSELKGKPVHALAAVARPEDFFAMLRAQGLVLVQSEALPDHYDFDSWKSPLDKNLLLICTEKDAIKLWRTHPEAWAVPLELHIAPGFFTQLDASLSSAP
jgi:tetraacyldisaccharide 4'-kinase